MGLPLGEFKFNYGIPLRRNNNIDIVKQFSVSFGGTEIFNYFMKYYKKFGTYPNEITILTYDALGLIYCYSGKNNGEIRSVNNFYFKIK